MERLQDTRYSMKKHIRFSLKTIRYWERQLRYPVAATVFAVYVILSYLYLKEETIYLPKDTTPVTFYSNQTGNDLRKTLLAAINEAKESITIFIFSLTDPHIMNALKKQADNGVKINLIQDAVATKDIERRVGPKVSLYKRRTKGLMHDKIVVVDHKLVWFGSVNFTPESFQLHANLFIGIQSKELAAEIEKKGASIFEERRYKAPPITIKAKEQTIEFFFLPDVTQAEQKLLKAIETAKKSVKVAMYTFTNKKLQNALIEAKKRAVDVQVVIDFDSAKHTSAHVFQSLKRAGMNVFVSNRRGLLHHKLVIIDDESLATGSANWTKAAFSTNDDVISFISPLTREQKEFFQALWKVIIFESKPSLTS